MDMFVVGVVVAIGVVVTFVVVRIAIVIAVAVLIFLTRATSQNRPCQFTRCKSFTHKTNFCI